jgi:UDP-glucose 4-epimerase
MRWGMFLLLFLTNPYESSRIVLASLVSSDSLTIRPSAPQPIFHQCDLRDESAIDAVFAEHEGKGGIWAVVHLAALKAVGESGEIPLDYYKVNVGGSLNLMEVSLTFFLVMRTNK